MLATPPDPAEISITVIRPGAGLSAGDSHGCGAAVIRELMNRFPVASDP